MTEFYADTTDVDVLRERVEELSRIRQAYAVQLGSSLYDATKDDPNLRWGRESLYDGIAECDADRETILARIEALGDAARTEEPSVESDAVEVASAEEQPVALEPDVLVEEAYEEPAAEDSMVSEAEAESVQKNPSVDVVADDSNEEPQVSSTVTPEYDEPAPAAVVPDELPLAEENGAICPTCGAPVDENDRFCMTCGTPIVHDEPASTPADDTASIPLDETVVRPLVHAPQADVAPTPEPATPSEPTCPRCGAVVSAADKFCMNCGSSLAPAPVPVAAPNVCPSCGNPVDPSFKFCMTCGHKLQ